MDGKQYRVAIAVVIIASALLYWSGSDIMEPASDVLKNDDTVAVKRSGKKGAGKSNALEAGIPDGFRRITASVTLVGEIDEDGTLRADGETYELIFDPGHAVETKRLISESLRVEGDLYADETGERKSIRVQRFTVLHE